LRLANYTRISTESIGRLTRSILASVSNDYTQCKQSYKRVCVLVLAAIRSIYNILKKHQITLTTPRLWWYPVLVVEGDLPDYEPRQHVTSTFTAAAYIWIKTKLPDLPGEPR